MIDRQLIRRAEVDRDLGPQHSLTVRLPKATHGLPYTGLLRWQGDNSKLVLYFATVIVTVHGSGLLDKYGPLLADQRLRQLVAPLRTDGFSAMREGSEGVERIDVFVIKSSE